MMEKLLADLQNDEGWRDRPYRDHLGFLTIGFGFLIDERKPAVTLPKPVGLFWLEYLVEQRWYEVLDAIPWVVDQPEEVQRALGNMAYQLGLFGLLEFEKMLEALKNGQRELASIEAMDSKWARQTPGRARRVAKLLLGPAP